MKKIIGFLIGLMFLLPLSVYAGMSTSDSFDVGNSIIVALTADDTGTGFHVLKDSKAGEDTVLALYDGNVGTVDTSGVKKSLVVYDEPYTGHDTVTTVLDNAYIYQTLTKATTSATNPWRVESIRLLDVSDLTNLGITANASGVYEIKKDFKWLAPTKLDVVIDGVNYYDYWTQSAATIEPTATVTDPVGVYYVKYNEARTDENGVYATLEKANINVISNGPEYAIRPVIEVKKEYILCNNDKPSTPTPTGVKDYYIPLVSIIALTGAGIIVLRKKNLFNKI